MNPRIAIAICIVACVGGAAIPAPIAPGPQSIVNLTISNLELTVANNPGMIWYGSPEGQDRILIMPAAIRELDGKGKIVNFREGRHLFSTFNTTLWNITGPFDTDIEGVAASGVNLTTTLSNNANLLLSALLFQEDGIVVTEDEQFNVTSGSMRLYMKISDWAFCKKKNSKNGCKGRGRFLEVDLALKGLTDTIELITNNTWNLGEDVMLWLNPEALVDEADLRTIKPVPLVFDANSTSIFPTTAPNNYTTNLARIRFPEFGEQVEWDAYIWGQ